jgi:lycopene cyclase domain-containing protein
MQSYTYLLVDLACIFIPFLASFYSKHAFYKDWTFFFKANVIVTILFLVWDYFFTEAGIWGFNPDYILGIYLGNLPIEEILFFIAIPYACVFTYFALTYLINNNPLAKIEKYITYLFICVLLVVAVLNYDKLYTSVTFFSTSLFLIYLTFKKQDLALHYLSYFIILPFFFMSNGLLTGSFIAEPIVWYNDAENLGIRLVTIPIEDSIYGMLLIFMNIELYRFFKGPKLAAG